MLAQPQNSMPFKPARLRLFSLLVFAVCILAATTLAAVQETTSELQSKFDAKLAAIAPDDAPALFDLGFEYYEGSDDTEHIAHLELAEIAFKKALEVDPDHPYASELATSAKNKRDALFERANPDFWKMGFAVIGGLGLFLLGMKNMSEGIQAVAGNRMRKMINAVTDNRLMAIGVGIGVTTLVQSSSITTVIVVGLVNSALMQLHQAIGVIVGANIGTTITGWILVLKIGKYGLPIVGISVFVYLFSKKDRWKYLAMGAMGLGLVFFGLEMMKNGFKPMKDVPMFEEAFSWFVADDYLGVLKCAAVGCILTFLVQSSSATLGITIGLASTGVIPFETAAALVLGENIGTTITAWLASIGTTTVAKRAAYAHVAFNLFGVAWITAVFPYYILLVGRFVEWYFGTNPIGMSPSAVDFVLVMSFSIATVHTGFNVVNTLMFIPFLKPFASLLERLIKDSGVKETGHLRNLDIRTIDSPILAIATSRGEINRMADGVAKMMVWIRDLISAETPDRELADELFAREKIMDNVQEEVIQFLTVVLTSETPHSAAIEARRQLRIADEYESISDYISGILKARLRLDEEGLELDEADRDKLLTLNDKVADYVALVSRGFADESPQILTEAQQQGDEITALVKQLRSEHLESIISENPNPIQSMSYSTMLNGYRKVKDHALNIAEAYTD